MSPEGHLVDKQFRAFIFSTHHTFLRNDIGRNISLFPIKDFFHVPEGHLVGSKPLMNVTTFQRNVSCNMGYQ